MNTVGVRNLVMLHRALPYTRNSWKLCGEVRVELTRIIYTMINYLEVHSIAQYDIEEAKYTVLGSHGAFRPMDVVLPAAEAVSKNNQRWSTTYFVVPNVKCYFVNFRMPVNREPIV